MKKIINILLVVFIFLLLSCKKDKVPTLITPPTGDNCPEMYELRSEEYPFEIHQVNSLPSCPTSFEFIETGDYKYSSPVLNPLNAFEFAFLRQSNDSQNTGSSRHELCIYNFCKNKLIIVDQDVISFVDWSVKGWILYRSANNYEYVKLNPTTNEKISLGILDQASKQAIWNSDGTKFIVNNSNNGIQLYNESGELIQNYPIQTYSYAWYNDDTIIYSTANLLKVLDLNTGITEIFQHTPNINAGRIFVKENQVYANTNDAIIIATNQSVFTLNNSYKTYFANHVQPINTSNFYLLQRTIFDTTDYNLCKIYVRNSISIFNSSTNTERRIILPN
jgi:hypothetical protein